MKELLKLLAPYAATIFVADVHDYQEVKSLVVLTRVTFKEFRTSN